MGTFPASSDFEPIKKTSLSQKLIEYFIRNIENGTFKIGEKITNEIDLAEQINVSRNVLRESMKVLENYGILHTVNGRGTIVAEDAMANIQSMRFFEQLRNDSSVLDILEARLIIEPRSHSVPASGVRTRILIICRKSLGIKVLRRKA